MAGDLRIEESLERWSVCCSFEESRDNLPPAARNFEVVRCKKEVESQKEFMTRDCKFVMDKLIVEAVAAALCSGRHATASAR